MTPRLAGRLLLAYAVLIVGITMVVNPGPLLRESAVHLVAALGLSPGDATRDSVAAGLEVFANVWLFIPVGLLVALRWRRLHWWQVVAVGLAISSAIEVLQLILLDSREATVRDLTSNTLGTALGAAMAMSIVVVRGRVQRG